MKIGCSIDSRQLAQYRAEWFGLPLIELEDCLHAGFLDEFRSHLPRIRSALDGYPGEILVSGPFIDLNPGSPERLNVEITSTRFAQAYEFAHAIGATEIIFLSSFLPVIRLAAYDEDWVERSTVFWRAYMESVDPAISVALGNTFEESPAYLVRVAAGVDHPRFHLAIDLGHCLVYSKVGMDHWAGQVSRFCRTVYVHSNDGAVDSHAEPQRGILESSGYLPLVARQLPEARLVAKMNNRDSILASVAWIGRHTKSNRA